MRRHVALVALALLLASSAISTTAAAPTKVHRGPCAGQQFNAQQFRGFSASVWPKSRWERGAPPGRTARAARHKIRCALGAGHAAAMRARWRADRLAYGRYRALRLIAPYPGGGTWWAIPYYIVVCESHGEWTAYNPSGALGPYQLLGWGAPFPVTTWRARMEHHQIAAELWAGGAGASNWVCA